MWIPGGALRRAKSELAPSNGPHSVMSMASLEVKGLTTMKVLDLGIPYFRIWKRKAD